MQLQLSGRNVEITQALHNFVHEKLGHLKSSVDQITSVHVVLFIDKLQQCAEAEIHVPGKIIFAEAKNSDMYAAIDKLVDKLSSQLRKYKEKHHG